MFFLFLFQLSSHISLSFSNQTQNLSAKHNLRFDRWRCDIVPRKLLPAGLCQLEARGRNIRVNRNESGVLSHPYHAHYHHYNFRRSNGKCSVSHSVDASPQHMRTQRSYIHSTIHTHFMQTIYAGNRLQSAHPSFLTFSFCSVRSLWRPKFK